MQALGYFLKTAIFGPPIAFPMMAWERLARKTSRWRVWAWACLPWALILLVACWHGQNPRPCPGAFALWMQCSKGVGWLFEVVFGIPGKLEAVTTGGAFAGIGYWLSWLVALVLWAPAISACSLVFAGPLHLLLLHQALKPYDPTQHGKESSHGSAFWGDKKHAQADGALLDAKWYGGLMLGRLIGRVDKKTDPRYRVWGHVLTCAPTGAGKGVGCVIPNLLEYPGSVFCLDVKGENYAVTADCRQHSLGQNVYLIDPFGVTGDKAQTFNWLDHIDTASEECISDAATLADTLVLRDQGVDSHWDDSAAALLQGLVLHVASFDKEDARRHVGTLRELLTQPEVQLLALLEKLGQEPQTAFGIVARSANTFLAKADRERSSVLSTAIRHTAFLDDPRIVNALRVSGFDFRQLKQTRATVYLVLPPDKLHTYSRFTRATLGLALQAMMRVPQKPRFEVLFLLDEFAQLGRFAAVEESISILRGYGVWLWLLIQDLSQLQAVYPKWRTFLANATLQAFGTQDFETARYLSQSLGSQTIKVESEHDSGSKSKSYHARPLMTPDEVRCLSQNYAVALVQGRAPQMLRRLDYRSDAECQGLAAHNPMHSNMPLAG